MLKKRFLLVATVLFSTTIYSCKKETQELTDVDVELNNATKIIKINNTNSQGRVDLNSEGLVLNFQANAGTLNANVATDALTPAFPYQLVYKGKIAPQIGVNNNALSALEVSPYGNYYAIAYQTPGEAYGGGVDIFQLQASGTPQLVSAVSTTEADVTCLSNGNGRLYLGMDLETHEDYSLPAPSVAGIIKVEGNSLTQAQVVGLQGYSTKDIKYNESNGKLYAASANNGGISIISFTGQTATKTAFQSYGEVKSITFSNNDIIATNGYSYATFNPTTAVIGNYKHWIIPSNQEGIGSVASTSNGNFLFGNNYYLIYVDKNSNALLDQVDVAGSINSISIVNDKIYISTGSSLIVAQIENDKIKILARTHFPTAFGGGFNVLKSRVIGSTVIVACGDRGTYIFDLKKI